MGERRAVAAGLALAGSLLVGSAILTACTGSPAVAPASTPLPTPTVTVTMTRPVPTTPLDDGPTTSRKGTCSLLPKRTVHLDVGMRLDRVTVQRAGGKQVGCTFYALQHPTAQCPASCLAGEHLPGPKQPVVQLAISRWAGTTAAHNAMVRLATAGTNPQQVDVGRGRIGLAYQIDFYRKDHGKDWACAFNIGSTLAVVKTVTTGTSVNVVTVARRLARSLR
jgi:hypothetical protein